MKKSLFIGLVFLVSLSLSAQMHKKPIINDGKLDSAIEALDTTKSSTDSVKESRTTIETRTNTTTTTTNGNVGNAENGTTISSSNTTVYCCVNSKTPIEITSRDGETRVDYQEYKVNDGEYKKYNGPFTLADEGNNTITYRAVDIVGNKEAAKVMIIVVDNTPPTLKLVPTIQPYVSANTQFAPPDGTYQIVAEDAPAGVKAVSCSVNNGPVQPCDQPLKLNPGPNIIKYSAIDKAGNPTPEYTYSVNVDGSVPEVAIVESQPLLNIDGKAYAKKGTSFNVKGSDPESGISKLMVKVDNSGDFVQYLEPINFNTTGEHVIEAYSINNIGAKSEIKKLNVLVDVNPPVTQIRAVTLP